MGLVTFAPFLYYLIQSAKVVHTIKAIDEIHQIATNSVEKVDEIHGELSNLSRNPR